MTTKTLAKRRLTSLREGDEVYARFPGKDPINIDKMSDEDWQAALNIAVSKAVDSLIKKGLFNYTPDQPG